MFFNRIKHVLTFVALLVTAWASLATSSRTNSIDNGDLYVISDCVNPVFEQTVKAVGGTLTSGVDYTQIGFPTSTVHLGQDSSGPHNNGAATVSRTCSQSYGKDSGGDGKFIYSCSDDGAFVCSIVIINQ